VISKNKPLKSYELGVMSCELGVFGGKLGAFGLAGVDFVGKMIFCFCCE
jgi:hypothetical protein